MACRFLVVSLAVGAVLASVSVASAQGLDMGIGWHRLAEKTPHGRGPEAGARLPSGQPLYSLGVFLNDFGGRHRSRIGFRCTTHQTLHEINGIGKSFRMQCLLFDYQRQALWHNPSRVVVDVCAGVSIFSTHIPEPYDYCDDPFCNLPATAATLAPGLGWQCQVARQATLQAGLWYYWFLAESEDVIPFRSGFAFLLGLGYTIGAK